MTDLLVVAGEASGDRAGAAVIAALGSEAHDVVGMGGPALASAGVTLVSDLRRTTALGLGEVARRAWGIAVARSRVLRAATPEVRAALLVNYSEFNAGLAPVLHARGIRVLWYGAPQVWAWRAARTKTLRPSVDRMAVMLPFEEPLWRAEGVDAEYVGHPAMEATLRDRESAKSVLGLTPRAKAVAILPGSRPHEVRSLLRPMLEGYERLRRDRASIDGRVLLAASLDDRTREHAIRECKEMHVDVHDVDARAGASVVLRAFDVALCASGTASLEATLARAIPVVAYRVGWVTELAARTLLQTPYIALPNVLLGRRAFAELLQRDVHPKRIATELARALDSRERLVKACDDVEAALGTRRSPSKEVARLLLPWLRDERRARTPPARP